MQHVGKKAKGKSQNGCFKKTKHVKFSENKVSYPMIRTRTYHGVRKGVRNFCFSKNLACFVFLEHPFCDSTFCLITNELIY